VWIRRVTAGELIGFTAPALAGAATARAGAGQQVAALVCAGAVEGAVLGIAQSGVLQRVVPAVSRRRWIAATAVAAAIAWLLGMVPSATHGAWDDWPTELVVAAGVPLGLALLLSLGVAQALVLPSALRWRLRWVGLTAVAWCAGIVAFTVVSTPLWRPGQPAALVLVIGCAAAAAMALVMATITAQALPGLARAVDQDFPGGSRTRDLRPSG